MPLLETYNNPLRGIWHITENVDELLDLLDNKEVYRSGLKSFKTEKRKLEWLATRALLKELMGEELVITYHDTDAPYLQDSPYSISISHTQEYVAVLLQDKPYSGVDIERRGDRILKVQQRFMTEEESATIGSTHETDHLLIYWCAKEALFKLIDQKEVDFRRHLRIEPFEFALSGTLIAHETRTKQEGTYTFGFEVFPEYVLVWSE